MKKTKNRILKRLLFLFAAAILALALFIFVLVIGIKQTWWGHVPSHEELLHINNHQASSITAIDGTIIDKVYEENRTIVSRKNIPSMVVDALIATEDSRFFEHQGVDFIALSRVFFRTIILRQAHAGGGSTISQQLAKNLYGRKGSGRLSMLINKLSEMIIASRLEEVYTKDEIIVLYLNTVSFGENVFGIENAAQRYFSKHSKQLQLNEACILIGILKGNTFYNPRLYPERSLERKNLILSLMREQGYITEKQKKQNQACGLALHCKSASDLWDKYGYFTDMVKHQAIDIIESYNKKHKTNYNILTDGLTIKTTLDNDLQLLASKAIKQQINKLQAQLDKQLKAERFWKCHQAIVNDELTRLNIQDGAEKKHIALPFNDGDSVFNISSADSIRFMQSKLQAALLAIVPSTGAIKAWIGGRSFQFFPYNRVTAQRQVGSTFKPFVYYTALQEGIDPCEYFENSLKSYSDYEDWTPSNADSNYTGYYTMKGALAHSINTITAQLILKAGVDKTIETARKLGISSELPQVPALALGTASISLFEMLQAYACFANMGLKQEIYSIESIKAPDGTLLYSHKTKKGNNVLDKKFCQQLTLMLQEVVKSGTAHRLTDVYACNFDIAAKTGTTQDNTDGWFIGFTPKLVMGVWVGCDKQAIHFTSTEIGQGANTALPIWAKTMRGVQSTALKTRYIAPFEYDDESMMDCEPYKEEKESFFGRLFGSDKKKKDKTDASENKKEVDTQTKTSTADEKPQKRGFGWWFKKKNKDDKP